MPTRSTWEGAIWFLLELDPDRLNSPIRVEAVAESPERFPHLYGEINPDAVITARPLVPGPDGRFDPPS